MSEPRVLLLGGNPGRWKASEKIHEASTMNSGEAWVFAFNGDFVQNLQARVSDLHGYDIVIANADSFAVKHLLELSDKRPSDCKWVTLLEGDALDYIKPRPYIRGLLDNSDLVNCINIHTELYFRTMTSAPVRYLGFPYPAEGIRALSTPIYERRREIFLGPMLLSRWSEYFCARDLGIKLYGYENRITRKWRTIRKNLQKHGSLNPWHLHEKAKSLYKEPNFSILREEPLPDFFRRNGGAYLWLNLDQRYTWGRYVLDAAALQVPIITTRSTGHAETFFPQTMLDNEFELEWAFELMKRLLNDQDFYNEVSAVPIERFAHLQPEVKKKELLSALYS